MKLKKKKNKKPTLRKGLYYNRNIEATAVPGASRPVVMMLKENKQKVNTAERAQSKK